MIAFTKTSKVIISLAVVVTLFIVGWQYVHTHYFSYQDCFPEKIIDYRDDSRTFWEKLFNLSVKCGSY